MPALSQICKKLDKIVVVLDSHTSYTLISSAM